MNDTPETDKIWDDLCDSWCNWSVDFAHEKLLEKSRELERERDRLLEQQEQWRLSSVCRELVEQRDRLAEALERIANNNVQDELNTDYAYLLGRMEGIAKIALQSLNQPNNA